MKIKLFVIALALLGSLSINAQTFKLGYTNIEYILTNLPDSKEIQTKLSTEKAQYDKLYQEKLADAIVRGIRQYFVKHPPTPKSRLAVLG